VAILRPHDPHARRSAGRGPRAGDRIECREGVRERLLGGISAPRIEAIAVLPVENLSEDPGQDYFAVGMTQMLIADMQCIATFRTIGPNSVMQYKKAPKPLPDVARELHIDAVVAGSVLRSGDRVRLVVNLTHASTRRHLWGQTYERDLRDILGLSAEVCRAVAREIKAGLTPQQEARLVAPRPVNPQAYDALLRGMWGGNPAKTEDFLKQAVQIDPAYAQAYDYLAQTYYMRAMYPARLAPKEIYPKAKEAAQKAVSLNPNIFMSHRILGTVALEYDWDFIEAEKELKRSVELVPSGPWAHHMYAHFLLSMGRMEEAKAETRRAIEVDPRGSTLFACASWHDIATGQYEDAEKHASQALSLGAADQLARLTLGWSYGERRRFDEAIPEFQKAVVGWQNAVFPTAALGHAYAVSGQESAAREVLDKLLARSKTEYVSAYEIAAIYAGLGDRDRAFEWLEKAYEERASLLVYFRMDPRIWSLRSDARFQELLRRMNFPRTQ
jgi:TolB-like protein/tetratricopeptide (TPR) repeat protein